MSDLILSADVPRQIWDRIKRAVRLPALVQDTDVALTVKLGERNLGWTLQGQTRIRPGSAVDLSTASKVRLIARRMPERPALIERETRVDRSSLADRLFSIFDIEGSIVTAADGEVSFTIPRGSLDTTGRILLEVRIEWADGTQTVSRFMKTTVHPTLA